MDAITISAYTKEPQVFAKEVSVIKTTEYVTTAANTFARGNPSPTNSPQSALNHILLDTLMNASSGIQQVMSALLALLGPVFIWCRKHMGSGPKALYVVPFLFYPAAALMVIGLYLIYAGRKRSNANPSGLGPPVGKVIGAPATNPGPLTIASAASSPAKASGSIPASTFDMTSLSAAVPSPPAQTKSLPPPATSWEKKKEYYGPLIYPMVRTACKSNDEANKVTTLLLQRSEAELKYYLSDPYEFQTQVASTVVSVGMGALKI
ncbi:hypothetical protein F4809DRAFT_592403 [Biscogniauxia mediterranea]|nr:hypothetical protein F4809DRAFT_592403 [Biscogniauxia mediterranea]